MKTLQNKIDMNNEVKNNPTRFDAHYYAELLVAPWFEDTDPRLFEFGDVVVKAFKCCPANGFTEKAAGWLVSYEREIDGHTQAHTEHVTTEVLALQLAELYRVKADEQEPREDISEGMTVYPDDCLAEWHGRAAKVVRRWLADWGTWCLELEFSDGTHYDYAEKYVLTHQPWSVVGATCHHRWADSDVVLTVTAVGQYYGIKAESDDGKVKWTGLARDFVPCTPDGRDLLPEPPAEVVIDEPDYYSEYQKLGHQEQRPTEWIEKATSEEREAYYRACVELERMAGDGLPLVIRADSADLSVNPWNALDKRVKTARVFHLGDRVKVKDGNSEVTGIVNGIRCNEGSLALGGWCTHYNIQWDKQYQYTTGYGTATGCGNIGPERIELIERAEFCPEPTSEWLQPGEKVAHYLDYGDGTGDWLTGNVTGYDLDDSGKGVTVIYGEYRTPLKGMVKYQPEMDGKAA